MAKELVGLVVGKGGRTLGDVKQSTGVELIEVDQNGPRVIVIGPTQETVDAAREMLEFVVERVPVEPEQIGWLIGRGGKNFKELQEKTRVTRLNVDKATSTVILVGTATAVAAAQLYIDTHLEYLAEYDKEKAESERLQHQLDALTVSEAGHRGWVGHATSSGRIRGRGNGRGRGGGVGRGGDAEHVDGGGGIGGKGRGGNARRAGSVRSGKGDGGSALASPLAAAHFAQQADGRTQQQQGAQGVTGRAPGGPKRQYLGKVEESPSPNGSAGAGGGNYASPPPGKLSRVNVDGSKGNGCQSDDQGSHPTTLSDGGTTTATSSGPLLSRRAAKGRGRNGGAAARGNSGGCGRGRGGGKGACAPLQTSAA